MAMKVEGGEVSAHTSAARLTWAVATASKQEHDPCGDGFVLVRDGDRVMFAMADGAGSGMLAKSACDACLDEVATSGMADLRRLFDNCHRRLIGSRGAALAVAVIDLDSARMEWAALGDIDGVVFPANGSSAPPVSAIQRGGTLGYGTPNISPQIHRVARGQMIALSTDGVSRRYRDTGPLGMTPERFVTSCLDTYGRDGDDRTIAALGYDADVP